MTARPGDDGGDGPDGPDGPDGGEKPREFRFVNAYTADTTPSAEDGRVFSPSTGRNAEVVAATLQALLGTATGPLVEIGSGTGQHAATTIPLLPGMTWQPTDRESLHFDSITAWATHAGTGRIHPPVSIDATTAWDRSPAITALGSLTAVFAANVIHIAPWVVAEGIVAGAGRALAAGGMLILYGPFREGDAPMAEGNQRFDRALRERDPAHGVRDLNAVAALAEAAGMGPPAITRMPANNLTVAFTKA